MGKVRIELNSPGIRTLLRSPEMQAVLKDRADTVKDRCGDGYESYVAPPARWLWWRPLPARPMTTTRPTTPC